MIQASEPKEPYISLKKLAKSFKIGGEIVPIFAGLDLTIASGEFVAIMGPSGSGKSTLLNILAGMESADAGEIHIGGARLDHMGETARSDWRAHNTGIVFQFYNLLPMLTAAENVELPLLLKPLTAKQRNIRVDKVVDLVGLTGRGKQYPRLMSGGQQQRVGIARAIVTDPALILCDEPTGNLDRRSADDILAMLRFLNRELHKTIIMVTHDPSAAHYAGRMLHLDKGIFTAEMETA